MSFLPLAVLAAVETQMPPHRRRESLRDERATLRAGYRLGRLVVRSAWYLLLARVPKATPTQAIRAARHRRAVRRATEIVPAGLGTATLTGVAGIALCPIVFVPLLLGIVLCLDACSH